MKITVFTSNQARHLSLIARLAGIADTVYAVQECTTTHPGEVADFFRKSDTMQRYFSRVIAAEREVFGGPRFMPANVRQLALKMGDVSRTPLAWFGEALNSDVFVVFGASFIRGELCEHLVARGAINIHMGVSPFYRGSSTNFWALYDHRPDLVGATIHQLSAGLDSGPMLFHALPKAQAVDPFVFGMNAVRAAHESLVAAIGDGSIRDFQPVAQDRSLQMRYTRNADFTDAVAGEYLERLASPESLFEQLKRRDLGRLLRPIVA